MFNFVKHHTTMEKNTIHNYLTACIIAVLSCALVPSCQKETIDEQQTTQANTNTKPEYVAPEEEDVLIEAAEKATLMSHEEKDGVTTFRFTEAFVSEITKKEVALVSIKSEHFYFQSDKHDACILVFKDKKTTKLQYNNDLSLSLDHLTNVQAYPGESVEIAFELTASGRGGVEITAEADKGSFELDYKKDRKEGSIHVVLPDEDKSEAHVRLILDDGVNKTYYNIHAEGYYIEFTSVQGGMTLSGEKGEKTTLTVGYITNLAEPALELSSENESVTYEILSSTQDEQTGGWESVIEFAFSSDNNTGDDVTADVTVAERSLRYGKTSVTLIQGTLQPVRKDGQVFFDHWALKKAMNAIADRDGDGEVSFEEALKVTKVNLSHKEITNIHGLEYFKNIEWLDLSYNKLDEIILNDIGAYSKLKYLNPKKNNPGYKLNITGCYPLIEVENWYNPDFTYDLETLPLPYESTDYSHDGTVEIYQEHTKGNGINIVFFSHCIDVDYDNGMHKVNIDRCVDEFFSYAPLENFKEYFNIYEFVNIDKTPDDYISFNYKPLSDYQNQFLASLEAKNKPYKVYFLSEVGGCDGMADPFPFSSNYKKVWLLAKGRNHKIASKAFPHEMGHALAKLADQYKESHYAPNCSYYSYGDDVPWKKFLTHPNYKDRVTIYDMGWGYYPNNGEYNVMCQGVGKKNIYFDSPSRFSFFCEIYKEANNIPFPDIDELFEKFVEYDVVNNDIPI